jgi:excisionase family DNA binding protein
MDAPAENNQDRLLTAREAATQLHVTPRTVYLWIQAGKLQAVRISERVTRIPASEVARLLQVPRSRAADRDALPRVENEGVFWDVDVEGLDPCRHRRFIIERILEYGRPVHVAWLFRTYAEDEILSVARTSRALSHRAAVAWTNILEWRARHVA